MLEILGLPLLGFAVTDLEEEILKKWIPSITSVSLYGNYRDKHIQGVDARNLERFSSESFSAIFGCLLFDYFEEHEKALREFHRILEPGGIVVTHIASNRLLEGNSPPALKDIVKKREGYFNYLPDEAAMPSVVLGKLWFRNTMSNCGFYAQTFEITDEFSGETATWFIGTKSNLDRSKVSPTSTEIENPTVLSFQNSLNAFKPKILADNFSPRSAGLFRSTKIIPDDGSGYAKISVEIEALDFAPEASFIRFAEHEQDKKTGEMTKRVVALYDGIIAISDDLGKSWKILQYPDLIGERFWNSFNIDDTTTLIQTYGWEGPKDSRNESKSAKLYLLGADLNLVEVEFAGSAHWHGSWSIDQLGGTIMFAEYQPNVTHRVPGAGDYPPRNSRIFQSKSGGKKWREVFAVPPTRARHFHTLVADRYSPKTWWATTGDRSSESIIFRTQDDGETWQDLTNRSPQIDCPAGFELSVQSAQRLTALVVTSNELIWGCDDIFGPISAFNDNVGMPKRTGARMYSSSKLGAISPIDRAYCGQPIRSLVDVGAGYLAISESKISHPVTGLSPQVTYVSKRKLSLSTRVCNLPVVRSAPTGFTYSRTSRAHSGGVFFTYRGPDDVFQGQSRILKWTVEFE